MKKKTDEVLADYLLKKFFLKFQKKLNSFLSKLGQSYVVTQAELRGSTGESWEQLINNLLKIPFDLDSKVEAVSAAIDSAFCINRKEIALSKICLMTNDQLRDLFYASSSLGFLAWQHLAAVERLAEGEDWQNNNKDIWKSIFDAQTKIGLATTHIVRTKPSLNATEIKDGYRIEGEIPWVSGIDMFDYFVVAFQSSSKNIFALVSREDLNFNYKVKVSRHSMAAYGSTNTASLQLSELIIKKNQVISVTEINAPSRLKKSKYSFPETGIAKRALAEAKKILNSKSPQNKSEVAMILNELEKKIQKIQEDIVEKLNGEQEIELQRKRDDVIRNSIRLLVLIERGTSLKKNSLANLLNTQALLLDAFIQPAILIEKKIKSLVE